MCSLGKFPPHREWNILEHQVLVPCWLCGKWFFFLLPVLNTLWAVWDMGLCGCGDAGECLQGLRRGTTCEHTSETVTAWYVGTRELGLLLGGWLARWLLEEWLFRSYPWLHHWVCLQAARVQSLACSLLSRWMTCQVKRHSPIYRAGPSEDTRCLEGTRKASSNVEPLTDKHQCLLNASCLHMAPNGQHK